MSSCYCSNHDFSKLKCHNLHNVQLFFVSVIQKITGKELHKQPSEFPSRLEWWWMLPNSTFMTVTAISKSQLLKMAAARKIQTSL